jgi:hypothetical protein
MSFLKKFTNNFTPPGANATLKLKSYCVALGENLTGSLTLCSRENFDATEVRCEIQCVEQAQVVKEVYDAELKRTVPKPVEDSAVLFSAKPPMSGANHFANGETRDFPFSITLPAGGRPTYQAVDRSVTWTIKGVVAVDGRLDVTSSLVQLQVIAPAATPVVKEREVVVMIPCKYCGGLMEQTLTACPNCGAKRTV